MWTAPRSALWAVWGPGALVITSERTTAHHSHSGHTARASPGLLGLVHPRGQLHFLPATQSDQPILPKGMIQCVVRPAFNYLEHFLPVNLENGGGLDVS